MGWRETAAARRARTGRWTMKLVLMMVAEHARDGKCWPSQTSLAADCEMSERAVRGALAALEAAGFIKRESRHPNGGQSDLITLTLQSVEMDTPRHPMPGSPRNDVPGTPAPRAAEPIKNRYSPLTPRADALVWIDEGTAQFAAWTERWNSERGRPKAPWTSKHPDDRSRDGRWVSSEWPPAETEPDL